MRQEQQIEEIPVYMFLGFLESGKTTFAKETLIDRDFTEGEPTLLLVCEEGIEEYDEEDLKKRNIFVEYLDDADVNTEHLLDLQDKYNPTRVMIEYNGTWKMDKLFSIRVPKGWTVVQVISFVDAQTFDVYIQNMKAMMMEQLSTADMIIFNRCDENTKKAEYRRSLRAVNRRAQVIFENKDGLAEVGEDEVFLPYDINQPSIDIEDEDFGLFYIDACDNPDKYLGKKVHFKAMVHKPKEYNADEFVPGRFAMTCCADDIAFVGFKSYYKGAKRLRDRQWVMVTGEVGKEYYPEFQGEGPVIKVSEVAMTSPADEELVYFN
ncbi:MAG: GTPase [Lachnospiraceae bacterium]|nr:GTPase [Lachnospiraceae bacterium]